MSLQYRKPDSENRCSWQNNGLSQVPSKGVGDKPQIALSDTELGFGLVWFCFSLRHAGLLLLWPLPLRSTGSGRAGSAAMAHGPSCSAACGIFPDRGTNPCPLHRQADSQLLRHQRSPKLGGF